MNQAKGSASNDNSNNNNNNKKYNSNDRERKRKNRNKESKRISLTPFVSEQTLKIGQAKKSINQENNPKDLNELLQTLKKTHQGGGRAGTMHHNLTSLHVTHRRSIRLSKDAESPAMIKEAG